MLKRMSLALVNENKAATTLQSDADSTITEGTQSTKLPRPSLANVESTKLPRPSLANVVLSRKFAKRLSARMIDRKLQGSMSGGLQHEKEPTYRMEPKKKFSTTDVKRVVKEIMDDRLEGLVYQPKPCSNLIKSLSDEIKERIKLLGYNRYKIVCIVMLTPSVDQSLMASSRCTWDKNNDTFVTYTFKNTDIICNATVYGLYRE